MWRLGPTVPSSFCTWLSLQINCLSDCREILIHELFRKFSAVSMTLVKITSVVSTLRKSATEFITVILKFLDGLIKVGTRNSRALPFWEFREFHENRHREIRDWRKVKQEHCTLSHMCLDFGGDVLTAEQSINQSFGTTTLCGFSSSQSGLSKFFYP
jgi:hypothetical protein